MSDDTTAAAWPCREFQEHDEDEDEEAKLLPWLLREYLRRKVSLSCVCLEPRKLERGLEQPPQEHV